MARQGWAWIVVALVACGDDHSRPVAADAALDAAPFDAASPDATRTPTFQRAPIDLGGGHATNLVTASHPYGVVLATWSQGERGGHRRWARMFTRATGWGPVMTVPAPLEEYPTPAVVGVARSGEAVVMYGVRDLVPAWTQLWVTRFTPGQGWSAATRVDSGGDTMLPSWVGVDPMRRVTAIWRQSNGRLWARSFTPSGGWRPVLGLAMNTSWAHAGNDDAGNVHVAFATSVVSARKFDGSTWSVPTNLDTASGTRLSVSVTPSGRALVWWWRSPDGIFAARYEGDWLPAERVTSQTGEATMALTDDGAVIAAWANERSELYIGRRDSAGWRQQKVAERTAAVQLAVNRWGAALAAWQDTGLWFSTFESGWTTPVPFGDGELPPVLPHLTLLPDRSVLALWLGEVDASIRVLAAQNN